jgi:hypothetical protein
MTDAAESTALSGFQLFVTKLGFQGMIALGLVENPLTGRAAVNLDNARRTLADLEMLREKTAGNLSLDEYTKLSEVLDGLKSCLSKVENP